MRRVVSALARPMPPACGAVPRAQTGPPRAAGYRLRRAAAAAVRPRRGAALLLVLLLLLLLDCIVLSSLHLAVLERRLALNVDTQFRLRIRAESAVRAAAGGWDVATDTLTRGAAPRVLLREVSHDSIEVTALIQRIADAAFLLRGEARLRPPRAGHAAAALMLLPPALPPHIEPAGAALSAGAQVRIGVDGTITSPGVAVRIHDPVDLAPFSPSQVNGSIELLAENTDVIAHFDRIAALFDPPAGAASRYHAEALVLAEDFAGTLLVNGDLRVAAGTLVTGLVLARGGLVVEAGARIIGAAHAGMHASLDGSLLADDDAVLAALADAALRDARPFRGRAWIPAF
jgi:hypothetical protein